MPEVRQLGGRGVRGVRAAQQLSERGGDGDGRACGAGEEHTHWACRKIIAYFVKTMIDKQCHTHRHSQAVQEVR